MLFDVQAKQNQKGMRLILILALVVGSLCGCPSTCIGCQYQAGNYNCQCPSDQIVTSQGCIPIQTIGYYENSAADTYITVRIVIFCIIAGLTLIFFLVCCYRAYRRRREFEAALENQMGNNYSASVLHRQAQSYQIRWMPAQQLFNPEENCAVCLNGEVCLMTHCGHVFHPHCIWQWSLKQHNCPLCKSEQLFPSQIYCHLCNQQKTQVNGALLTAISHDQNYKPSSAATAK